MKRYISIILFALIASFVLIGCGTSGKGPEPNKPSVLTAGPYKVIHETEFGGVYADITIEGFKALGFAFGDSVDVKFSNGRSLEDIPFSADILLSAACL